MDGRLSEILQAEVPEEWPPADWEPHVLQLVLDALTTEPGMIGFHRYLLLERDWGPRVLIGSVGGFIWPDSPGVVEIGYGVLPAYRGKGYAREGTARYLDWLCARPEGYRVVAQTFPYLQASLHILESLGFVPEGPGREEGAVTFRLER